MPSLLSCPYRLHLSSLCPLLPSLLSFFLLSVKLSVSISWFVFVFFSCCAMSSQVQPNLYLACVKEAWSSLSLNSTVSHVNWGLQSSQPPIVMAVCTKLCYLTETLVVGPPGCFTHHRPPASQEGGGQPHRALWNPSSPGAINGPHVFH